MLKRVLSDELWLSCFLPVLTDDLDIKTGNAVYAGACYWSIYIKQNKADFVTNYCKIFCWRGRIIYALIFWLLIMSRALHAFSVMFVLFKAPILCYNDPRLQNAG